MPNAHLIFFMRLVGAFLLSFMSRVPKASADITFAASPCSVCFSTLPDFFNSPRHSIVGLPVYIIIPVKDERDIRVMLLGPVIR
jgi:hypothetical protein